MPELPEVTALADDLDARLAGRTVTRLDVLGPSVLKTFEPPASALSGHVIREVGRRGKHLVVTLDERLHLVLHLARAGWLRWWDEPPVQRGRPGRGPLAARLVLDAGGIDVTEAGTKKGVALWVVTDPQAVEGIARLGPDPVEDGFTLERFEHVLSAAGRAQIKGVLRDQSRIAGIGNAYSDEILHAARMSPFRPAAMPPEDARRLYEALRSTLEEARARAEGVGAAELKREKRLGMRVHGRTGEACPVCGDTIRQVTYADSSLQYCPTCQTGGKPLADRVLSRLVK